MSKESNIIIEFQEAIEKSKYILKFKDNWDDEGSPPYLEATWKRATSFLLNNAHYLLKKGVTISVPEILPGPDGS